MLKLLRKEICNKFSKVYYLQNCIGYYTFCYYHCYLFGFYQTTICRARLSPNQNKIHTIQYNTIQFRTPHRPAVVLGSVNSVSTKRYKQRFVNKTLNIPVAFSHQLRSGLHETRSELKPVWDFTSGQNFTFVLHYQHLHDLGRGETHLRANFTSVKLTEVKFQTAASFSCRQ